MKLLWQRHKHERFHLPQAIMQPARRVFIRVRLIDQRNKGDKRFIRTERIFSSSRPYAPNSHIFVSASFRRPSPRGPQASEIRKLKVLSKTMTSSAASSLPQSPISTTASSLPPSFPCPPTFEQHNLLKDNYIIPSIFLTCLFPYFSCASLLATRITLYVWDLALLKSICVPIFALQPDLVCPFVEQWRSQPLFWVHFIFGPDTFTTLSVRPTHILSTFQHGLLKTFPNLF